MFSNPKMPANALSQADSKLKIADHLLSTTYPFVKDPKLLVSVIDALFQAMELAIETAIEYEKNFKTLQYTDFESKIEIFRRKVIPKYALDPKIIDFLLELKAILESHRKSGVEFTKKEKFVISDNDYNLKTLDFEDARKKYHAAKEYIGEISKIVSKYE